MLQQPAGIIITARTKAAVMRGRKYYGNVGCILYLPTFAGENPKCPKTSNLRKNVYSMETIGIHVFIHVYELYVYACIFYKVNVRWVFRLVSNLSCVTLSIEYAQRTYNYQNFSF